MENMSFALTTKKPLHAHMHEFPPQLPWHSPDYVFLNRELLTVFPGIFRIPYLQEKPQLLFHSIMFFPAVPGVANYECCKQDTTQIPNYSGMIQKRVAIAKEKKKNQVSNVLQGRAGVYKPKAVLKGGFLEFDGEYLAQAAKSVSLNNVMLASVEQEQRLYFHLFHGTLIQM